MAKGTTLLQNYMTLLDEFIRISRDMQTLQEENTELRAEVDSLRRAIALTGSRAIDKLPVEVLQLIFHYTMPPPQLLDPALYAGPNSPWCLSLRNLKSMLSVRRQWYTAGLRLLYRDIVLRRPEQVPALVKALDAEPNTRRFVQSLSIRCYVPPEAFTSFQKDLTYIVDCCPSIISFSCDCPTIIPLPIASLLQITHLDLGREQDSESFFDILHTLSNSLTSLSFYFPRKPEPPDPSGLVLRNLETLTVKMALWSPFAAHDAELAQGLSMPKLTALTLAYEVSYFPFPVDKVPVVHMQSFLKIHGSRLKYLNLQLMSSSFWHSRPKEAPLTTILDLCPILEHLVVHPTMVIDFSHPTLKYLDVWFPAHIHFHENVQRLIAGLNDRRKCPALQAIRSIDPALNFPDLPLVFSPSKNIMGRYDYHYAGVDIHATRAVIFRNDLSYIDGFVQGFFEKHGDPIEEGEDDESDGSFLTEDESDEYLTDEEPFSETQSDLDADIATAEEGKELRI